MPKVNRLVTLEVTVEHFLKACSDVELQELDMLIGSEMKRREFQKTKTKKKVPSPEASGWRGFRGGKMINLQIQIQTEKAVEIVKSHGYTVYESKHWKYTDRTTEEGYYHTDYYCYQGKKPKDFIHGTHDINCVVAKIMNLKILELLLCEQPSHDKELNIINKVEIALKLRQGSLISSMRYRPIVDGKIIATKLVYDEINHATHTGRLLNCDHATVLHRLAKFEDYFATDADFREKFHKVKDYVYDRN